MALNEFYDYNGKCYTFAGKRTATASCLFEIMRETKLIGYYEKHEYRNVETMKQYDLW